MGQVIQFAAPQVREQPNTGGARREMLRDEHLDCVRSAKEHLTKAASVLSDGTPRFERLAWMIQDLCWMLEFDVVANNDQLP